MKDRVEWYEGGVEKMSEHLSFYCQPELKKRIVDISIKEQETVSWTIRNLIWVGLNTLKEKGFI